MTKSIYHHLKQINNTFFIISALIVNKAIFTFFGLLFLFLHLPINDLGNHIKYGNVFEFLQNVNTTIFTKACFIVVAVGGIILLIVNILRSIHTLFIYKWICKKKGLTRNKIFSSIFFYTTFLSKIYVPFVYIPILFCFISLGIYNYTILNNDIFNFWLYFIMSFYALFFIFYELYYIWKSCFIFEKLTKYQIKRIEQLEKEIK